jgi:hypothetical protein
VQPGTCIAAWLALDDCDEENGCMQVVVGSHAWPVLCTVGADLNQSFTDVTVPLPADADVRPVLMKAGDVLFFNGQLVHGSYPNTSKDRFRRSLIGHYIEGDAQQVGRLVPSGSADGWYPWSSWRRARAALSVASRVEQDGSPVIEMAGVNVVDLHPPRLKRRIRAYGALLDTVEEGQRRLDVEGETLGDGWMVVGGGADHGRVRSVQKASGGM